MQSVKNYLSKPRSDGSEQSLLQGASSQRSYGHNDQVVIPRTTCDFTFLRTPPPAESYLCTLTVPQSIHSEPVENNSIEEKVALVLAQIAVRCSRSNGRTKVFETLDNTLLTAQLQTYLSSHNAPFEEEIRLKNGVLKKEFCISFNDFTYKKVWNETGNVSEGRWGIIPELNGMQLVEGKDTFSDGHIQEGRQAYIPELMRMEFIKGKITYADRRIQEGKWAYIHQLNRICLVEGKASFTDGKIQKGKWAYIPELKSMNFVEGKVSFEEPLIKGKWIYIPELMCMEFVEEKGTLKGQMQEGKWAYIPELNRIEIVEGKISSAEGETQEGQFVYDSTIHAMRLAS